jgi:hypothetical protein
MAVGLGVLAVSASAAASAPRLVTLSYILGEGAGDCPSRAALHDAVAFRLGYVPFVTEASEHVDVSIQARGNHYRATVRLYRVGERVSGEREVEATVRGCDELVDALALSVSLALDPDAVERVKRPRRPRELNLERRRRRSPAVGLSVTPAPITGADAAQQHDSPEGRWTLGARVGVAWGLTPQVAPEITVESGYETSVWALGLELRAAAPLPSPIAVGAIEGGRALAGVHACAGLPWLRGCAQLSAGVLFLSSDSVGDARPEVRFMASGGGRLQLLWPLSEALVLEAVAGLEVPLVQASARIGRDVVWRSEPVGLDAAVGLFWRL